MRFTASEVAACTGGELRGADTVAHGMSFDSRTIVPGQAFVAVVAERDGHLFLDQAAAAGAAFALVGRGRAVDGLACVEVDDTSLAVTRVGLMCRARLSSTADGRVIGVTGSVGKTSTKDFVLAVLRSTWPGAHGAHMSFNNDLGVPVTLAEAPDGCPALVVEMGMRGHGEISRLCAVAQPHVGIVTAVGDAHGERVGGIEGVARAKAELVLALPPTGTAVLNADDHRVSAMAARTAARVITYGAAEGADIRFRVVSVDDDGRHTVVMSYADEDRRVTVPLPGLHMVSNACAAVAAGVAVGVPFASAVDAVASVQGAPGRMTWHTAADGTRVLDDTYNANPTSMEAALVTLAGSGAERKVAVLGAMAEITDPAGSHRDIAELCARLGIKLVALETDLYGTATSGLDEAVAAIGERGPGLSVLVKGSRSARTERVVARLLA